MFYLPCHIHYLPTVFLLPLYSTVPPEFFCLNHCGTVAILPGMPTHWAEASIFPQSWGHTFNFSPHSTSIARQTGRDWPSPQIGKYFVITIWIGVCLFFWSLFLLGFFVGGFLQLTQHLMAILQVFHLLKGNHIKLHLL